MSALAKKARAPVMNTNISTLRAVPRSVYRQLTKIRHRPVGKGQPDADYNRIGKAWGWKSFRGIMRHAGCALPVESVVESHFRQS